MISQERKFQGSKFFTNRLYTTKLNKIESKKNNSTPVKLEKDISNLKNLFKFSTHPPQILLLVKNAWEGIEVVILSDLIDQT